VLLVLLLVLVLLLLFLAGHYRDDPVRLWLAVLRWVGAGCVSYYHQVHICCATLPGMRERTVVVQSVSKTASATGWRIGWIISPPHITSKIRAVHDSIVIQVKKRSVLAICILNCSFYQDRLGTNIGKTPKKRRFVAGTHPAPEGRRTLPQTPDRVFQNRDLRILPPEAEALV
jgi:hypothetical protein